MESSIRKQFKVSYDSKRKKHILPYKEYQNFVQTCKTKFGVPQERNVYFVQCDDEDAEVDVEIIENVLPDKSFLIMKVDEMPDTENQMPDAVKDERDDDIESIMENSDELADNDKQDEDIKDRKQFSGEVPGKLSGACGSTEKSSDQNAFAEMEPSQIESCEEVAATFKAHAAQYGLHNIGNTLKTTLDKWKTIPLQIAVTGASGKGKSSFINTLRGLTENDKCAAEVGVTETTLEPTPYKHPKIGNFIVWDVPGVGTSKFPRDNYLENIRFDRYDLFIIVFAERFTDTDAWLMTELKKRKPDQHRFVIRTKVDNDLKNESRKARNGAFNEKAAFIRLKQKFQKEIKAAIPTDNNFSFFLISNHDDKEFDFPDLAIKLLKETPSVKRTTMIFGVATMSKDIVTEKAKVMRSRVWGVATASCAASFVPFSRPSKEIDIEYILEQLDFYRNQFALNDKSLEKIAAMEKISLDELKGKLAFNTPFEQFTTDGIALMWDTDRSRITQSIFELVIPLFGGLIGRKKRSYDVTHNILTDMIQKMEMDALKVLQYLTATHLC